ncbi:unnamed protein product [Musa banksii]
MESNKYLGLGGVPTEMAPNRAGVPPLQAVAVAPSPIRKGRRSPPLQAVAVSSSSSSDCRSRLAFNKKPKEKPNRSQVPGMILGTFYSLSSFDSVRWGWGWGWGGNGNGNGTGTATTPRWYRSRGVNARRRSLGLRQEKGVHVQGQRCIRGQGDSIPRPHRSRPIPWMERLGFLVPEQRGQVGGGGVGAWKLASRR